MSGMRISMNYPWNDEVRKALTSIAHFHNPPTGWQDMMAKMLDDTGSLPKIDLDLQSLIQKSSLQLCNLAPGLLWSKMKFWVK